MKKWLFLFLILGMLVVPWTGQAETWQHSFQQQIKHWTNELAGQDPRFAAFRSASFNYEALGPQSRQWLVTLYSADKKIGYMVMSEDDSGFRLLEYGLGEYSLFDESMVSPFLSGDEPLARHYAGLQSVWISDQGIYDAKSGEKYPSASKAEKISVLSGIGKDSSLTQAIHIDGVDDSIAWLKPERIMAKKEDLIDEIKSGEVSLVAKLFGKTVIAPFPVIGYHQWGQELFVELEDYGSRYVPFSHASQVGQLIQ